MGKKKERQAQELDEDGILNECATSLMVAFNYAVEHRDVEAMLAVSDRWLRLYDMLTQESHDEAKIKLGFLGDNNEQS